ncbi:MAG: hypothetical protein E7580_03820 [Ruminococcaceae bacterium]|nr:hypothetical protein [Oscillospiraceae bacterium]
MADRKEILGFLHYRTDLGDGVRTGIVFSDCTEACSKYCASYRFIPEHDFCEDFSEQKQYSANELIAYLLEERTMYYAGKLGISFLGKEPLRDPFFCADVAKGLKEAGIGLQIFTCGMCSMTAFELLDGLAESYVLRVFLPFFHDSKEVFDRGSQVRRVIEFFEKSSTPYRILIPVSTPVCNEDTQRFADYLLGLKKLRSVMIDFSNTKLSEEEIRRLKHIFLSRKIPLY